MYVQPHYTSNSPLPRDQFNPTSIGLITSPTMYIVALSRLTAGSVAQRVIQKAGQAW
jgi:hypothetical protein